MEHSTRTNQTKPFFALITLKRIIKPKCQDSHFRWCWSGGEPLGIWIPYLPHQKI